MPNWCVQNSLLRGPKKDVVQFCNILSSLLAKPDVRDNCFGKFWLGNVCEAFGYDFDKLAAAGARLRGNIDPSPETSASLCHPEAELVPFQPYILDEDTAEVRFSVTTAWGPSDWFNEMIAERYPACNYAWQATDEFGNFHACHNPKLIDLKPYEIEQWNEDSVSFAKGEEKEAAAHLEKVTGIPFTLEDILRGEDHIWEMLAGWNSSHPDDEVYFHYWEEE